MVLYNLGYCPSCGIYFVPADKLSNQARAHADYLSNRWQMEHSSTYLSKIQRSRKSINKLNEDNTRRDIGSFREEIKDVQPGKRKFPHGLVSTITSILAVLVISLIIYLLTSK